MVSRKVFAGNLRAERRTRKVGSGIEFADHRTYARGDDFRYIDWNLYGRLDKLLLRLFEEEEDLHIYILIDVSDSMSIGQPLPKLHYAMQVGAALTYVGLANLDRVSIIPFGDRLDRSAAAVARQEPDLSRVRFSAAMPDRRQDRARRVHEGLRHAEQAARARGRDQRLLRSEPASSRASTRCATTSSSRSCSRSTTCAKRARSCMAISRSSTARPATRARSRCRSRCSRRTSASTRSTARSSRRTARSTRCRSSARTRRSRSTSSCCGSSASGGFLR